MKISLRWLSDYIDFSLQDPQGISDAITAHTAEVDEVEVQGVLLGSCCVGKVLSITKHPNADKLQLCEVLTDKGAKPVVCGGTNLREGMRVAFAHTGARVKWHGEEMMTLEPVKIRGEKSEGMICAAEELGIETQFPECTGHDIVDLGDGDEDVGKPLQEYLGLIDTILHIDNHAITHRADLFSHIGFARECVAMGIATWKPGKKPSELQFDRDLQFTSDSIPFDFVIEEEHLMPRYCACVIEIDDLGETPNWMRERLEAVGWRCLSTAVDITNFVATEIGVPLHSFDADDIVGTVHMRKAKEGEKLTTLDKKERDLPEGALILSDDEGVFDLLGIMGGLRSSTKETTRRIYLHSASIDTVSIRKAIIGTGLRTDAGTVYEKGVPHVTTEMGFFRAAQLMLQLMPGARIVSELESVGDNGEGSPIELSLPRTQSLLGAEVTAAAAKDMLRSLDFTVAGTEDVLTVTPPLHRLGDIEGPHDLIEEVGRIYGYNNIEASLPEASIVPPERETRVHSLRDALQDDGYLELLPLSLLGPDLLQKCSLDPEVCVGIANAIGKETSLLTPSTLPALLEHAETNLAQVPNTLRTFHVSKVFTEGKDDHTQFGALITKKQSASLKEDAFLELKQQLQTSLAVAGYELSLVPSTDTPPFGNPTRTAVLQVDGKDVGLLFTVADSVCNSFGIPSGAAGAVINIDALLEIPAETTVFSRLPNFPEVSYDITVDYSHEKSVGDLLGKIRESSDLLESAEVVDLYGKQEGDYKLTLRCVYRSSEKTLTEQEAKKEFEKVEKLLN